MSVSREVVATINRVPVEKCNCRNCAKHSNFINDMLWCDAWNQRTRAEDFCSIFEEMRRCPHCGGKIVKRGSEYYCFSCHFWWESEDGKENADQES